MSETRIPVNLVLAYADSLREFSTVIHDGSLSIKYYATEISANWRGPALEKTGELLFKLADRFEADAQWLYRLEQAVREWVRDTVELDRKSAQELLRVLGLDENVLSQRQLGKSIESEPLFVPGELTHRREGNRLEPYWPGKNSGVTIGRGYDLGTFSRAEIRRHMEDAGISAAQINEFVKLSGVRGNDAEKRLEQLRVQGELGKLKIEAPQSQNLFEVTQQLMQNRARKFAGQGEYGVTDARWETLKKDSPAVVELLYDFAYNSNQYKQRRDKINAVLKDESLSQIEQLLQLGDVVKSMSGNLQGKAGMKRRLEFINDVTTKLRAREEHSSPLSE